jgi:hypothetical protein
VALWMWLGQTPPGHWNITEEVVSLNAPKSGTSPPNTVALPPKFMCSKSVSVPPPVILALLTTSFPMLLRKKSTSYLPGVIVTLLPP